MFFFFGQLSGMIKHIVSVDLMWKQNEDIYHCNTSVIIEASWAGAWNYLSQLFNIALLHQFSFLVWSDFGNFSEVGLIFVYNCQACNEERFT